MTDLQDITPEMLLRAYAMGVFPMAGSRHARRVEWYDPAERGILPLDRFHVPARLRRTVLRQKYRVTFDRDFEAVIRACADARQDTWINEGLIALYTEAHRRGFAHSAEARHADGTLAGGLYGLALGGAFFGESMFSHARDASKVALVHLAARLRQRGYTLLDAQFVNPHLLQFGCIEVPRAEYHRQLAAALARDVSFGNYSAGAAEGEAEGETGAASGAASDENASDFAVVAEFLQSITQTS